MNIEDVANFVRRYAIPATFSYSIAHYIGRWDIGLAIFMGDIMFNNYFCMWLRRN